MKILIDATEVNGPTKSLDIYSRRILYSLTDNFKHQCTILGNRCFDEKLKNEFGDRFICFEYEEFWPFTLNIIRHPLKTIRYLTKVNEYRRIANNYDVLLVLSQMTRMLAVLPLKCKKVSIVHDIRSFVEGGKKRTGFIKKIKGVISKRDIYYMTKFSLSSANKIVAISNFVKEEILSNLPYLKESDITVIHNSIELVNIAVRPSWLSCDDYILSVNVISEHKNLLTLLRAYSESRFNSKYKLLLVGKRTPYWENVIYPFILEHHLENKIESRQNLSDEELKYLYENAKLFVSPSLYEGFGYTPVEAAICKCPVICSAIPSLFETTMGLLNYYKPATDYRALLSCLDCILESPILEDRLEFVSDTLIAEYDVSKQITALECLIMELDVM